MNTSPNLPTRKLLVDLSAGFEPHWFGGCAFRSQYHNALSMSFPLGEQEFIDAVRECLPLLPNTPENASLHDTAKRFVAQEATHRHVHAQYNAVLAQQGLHNHWQNWITKLIAVGDKRGIKPIHKLAITAAFEHLTAVFADAVLRYPTITEPAQEPLRTLWRWHAGEEAEHKAVAFDIYQAIGGNYAWRVRWYIYVLIQFFLFSNAQTLNNLWHSGSLLKPSTWWGAAQFYFGRPSRGGGLMWLCFKPMLAYFKRDFHPWQHDNRALVDAWMAANAVQFRVLR